MEFEDHHPQNPEPEETHDALSPDFESSRPPKINHHSINPGARYRECLKNHAVGIGGHAVDGCREFLPAGADGTLDSLLCAACNCHRNFHRKELSTVGEPLAFAYRTPTGYLHVHRPPPPPLQLALPSTSCYFRDEMDEEMGNGGGGSLKKRFRTKFTAEHKDKMLALAERMEWRIQRHDEEAVQQLYEETGIKRHVFKVWMHNNKNTVGKKP
ncbi:zinc-finger homeodomain protein 1-like [Impatiens glandulifera]|uniref:zinc-finger homeodomain protein 1-like n=1 Tax=Impatiens glandulifera TaxID=253017 RepID=UPI001FB0C8C1|nr:zinc-finger homeodomain protein 1-like [Impatiens glandulifera]